MRSRSITGWLVAAGLLTWLFAVLGFYYALHKPFSAANALGLLRSATDILALAALIIVATALGYRCTRRVGYNSRLEAAVFSAGVGLGLLSLATLFLGLVGLFYRPIFWGLLAALGIALRREIGLFWQRLPEIRRPALDSRLIWVLVVCLGAILLLTGLMSFTPPVAWDSLSYHLFGAKLYIQNHRIVVEGSDILVGLLSYPALMEMLFTMALLLKGDTLGGLLHFSFLLMTLLALFTFARSYFSARAGWLAMALFCSSPAVLALGTQAYTDFPLVFYGFAALWACWRWHESGQRGWLALTGLLCGLAMGVKYTSAALPMVLGFLLLLEQRRLGWWAALKALLFVGSIAAVVAAPWYLKNLAFTGYPFYPYFSGGSAWRSFPERFFGPPQNALLYTAPWRLLIAPWDMTVLPDKISGGYYTDLGPLFLGLAPLLLLARRALPQTQRGVAAMLATFCATYYLIWLAGMAVMVGLMQARFLLLFFAALSVLLAGGLDAISSFNLPRFSLQRFLLIAVTLVTAIQLVSTGLQFLRDWPLSYILGVETREAYLQRRLGSNYKAIVYVNQHTEPESFIYFLWEPRSYYFERRVYPDIALDNLYYLVYRYTSAERIVQYWREIGVTHVLLNESGFQFIRVAGVFQPTSADVEVLHTLQANYLRPVYQDGQDYVLYELRAGPAKRE
jgi:hypothetical protein